MYTLTPFLAGSLIDLDGTFFIQLALFFFAFFMLRALIFRPMVALIDAREGATDGAIEEAKAMRKEAAEAESKFQEELRKVRLKAGEERDKLRADGRKLEEELLTKVRSETEAQMAEASQKLDHEAAKVRAAMEAETTMLAQQIAGKLLGRSVEGN